MADNNEILPMKNGPPDNFGPLAFQGGLQEYTVYVGGIYEKEFVDEVLTTERKYYAGVAMRENDALYFTLGDHLGSTSVVANADGSLQSEIRYDPFGAIRYNSGTSPTDYLYTGQREHAEIELYFYNARWYDSYLNRFIQPDSIVPDAGNPQDYDRYSYVRNNPLRYTDPSGHFCYDADKNKYSDGDCFDDMQQQLLDYFIAQLESGDYTDLEIMENLLNYAFSLNSDPAIALRAATEIVRPGIDVKGNWGFEFSKSKFYYTDYTDARMDNSGFGDLSDVGVDPNQISHFIGIAYIAAYREREKFTLIPTNIMVVGNDLNPFTQQAQVDRDLGYIAADYGEALVVHYESSDMGAYQTQWERKGLLDSSASTIQSYSYAKAHPIKNWWAK